MEISLVVDANLKEQAKLIVPAGALVDARNEPSMAVEPASDSVLRDVVNRVTMSRRDTLPELLPYEATLLSPAFVCKVASSTVDPFAVPLEVQSQIDRSVQVNGVSHEVLYQDVCLAFVYRLDYANGWRVWKCVSPGYDNRLLSPVRSAAVNASLTEPWVAGNVFSCANGTTYGFVWAPLRDAPLADSSMSSFWADNLIYIVLGLAAALAILFFIGYTAKRLHRYRAKLHETRDQNVQLAQEVAEMEEFGASAGSMRDEDVAMASNPMVIQIQDLQSAMDVKNLDTIREQAAIRDKESADRQEIIRKLRDDRDRMVAELQKFKAELNQAQIHSREMPTEGMPLLGGSSSSPLFLGDSAVSASPIIAPLASTEASAGSTIAAPAIALPRAQFNDSGRKKKKNID